MIFEEYWGRSSDTFKGFAKEIWQDAQKEQKEKDVKIVKNMEDNEFVYWAEYPEISDKIAEAILNQK